MNLNDPSIIFAQPAGRQLGVGGPGREGHWHNHMAQPGSLMGNGTLVKSGTHRVNRGGTVSVSLKNNFKQITLVGLFL